MTDSLKWIVSGTAGVVFVAALIGAKHLDTPRTVASSADSRIVQDSTPSSGYPAPEISIDTQEVRSRSQDYEALSHSSSMYGDFSYSRHHHSKHHSHKQPKTDAVGAVDTEMGMMSADDKKLRDAMERADRMDKSSERAFHIDPDNH